MDLPTVVVVTLFGLMVGSFLNVVIVRLAHVDWRDRRTLGGRSACPRCDHEIGWYDNLPVVSWLVLRGRCRHCASAISWRYPVIELLVAGLWGLVAATSDAWPDVLTGVVFMSVLVPVTVIDLDLRIIPDEVNYAAIFLGFACSLGFGPRPRFLADELWWVEVLAASLGAAAFLLLPTLVTRGRGMGMGDVKLAVALGAFLGAAAAPGMFVGFLLGILPSVWLILRRGMRAGRKSAIPFGPFLAAGGVVGWFWGPALLDAYLGTMA